MAYLLGKDAHAYIGTAVTAAITGITGATGEITNVTDVKVGVSSDDADVTTRGSGGWKQTLQTLKDASVTFTMIWKPGDAQFTAIKTAWLASTEIAGFFFDQAKTVTGAQGLVGNFTVSKFDKDESLTSAQKVDVELKPSSFTDWFTVS